MNCDSAEPRQGYRSKFYEELLEKEREQKDLEDHQRALQKKKQEKVNNYAKYVKEMYWPAAPLEKENISEN